MSNVSLAIQVFHDANGEPLEAGYIYVGEVGQDAATNQIQVYADAALSVPVAQPIRTLAGYPVVQGAAIALYVAENGYSVTVLDKDGVAILTNVSGPFGPTVPVTNVTTDLTLTVGSGGDYATLNEAIEAASLSRPAFSSTEYTVEISLLTGFVLAEQIIVKRMDLSWITITSVDVEVSIDRSALTIQVDGGSEADYPAFTAMYSAKLPIIDVLFNMDSTGTATGRSFIYLRDQSDAIVLEGGGCKNAAGRGIEARYQCRASAYGTVFTGCLNRAFYAVHDSQIFAESSDVSNCAGDIAVYALHGGSVVDFRNGVANDCADVGVWANRGAVVDATEATVNDSLSTNAAVRASDGARVVFKLGTATGSASAGLWAEFGAHIAAQGCDVSNSGTYGLYSRDGCDISAQGSTADDCGTYALFASHFSRIHFRGGNGRRAGTRGAYAERGSEIDVQLANMRKVDGVDTNGVNGDIVWLSNSIIFTLDAVGGLGGTVNTITTDGIGFQ